MERIIFVSKGWNLIGSSYNGNLEESDINNPIIVNNTLLNIGSSATSQGGESEATGGVTATASFPPGMPNLMRLSPQRHSAACVTDAMGVVGKCVGDKRQRSDLEEAGKDESAPRAHPPPLVVKPDNDPVEPSQENFSSHEMLRRPLVAQSLKQTQ